MTQTKLGQCRYCPKTTKTTRLYAYGVCSYHLAHPPVDKVRDLPMRLGADNSNLLLQEYFRSQWAARPQPAKCENCGNFLPGPDAPWWLRKASLAHIVPKRFFTSVMIHPSNLWWGCGDCHTLYDRAWSDAVKMPVWPTCLDRFRVFAPFIKVTEARYLPAPLRDLYDNLKMV